MKIIEQSLSELYEEKDKLEEKLAHINADLFIKKNITSSDYYHKWFKYIQDSWVTYYIYVEEVELHRQTLDLTGPYIYCYKDREGAITKLYLSKWGSVSAELEFLNLKKLQECTQGEILFLEEINALMKSCTQKI